MKKLKIVCAPDSFKESMSAIEACQAMEEGIHRFDPTIEVVKVPMADGGEGTLDALVHALSGEFVFVDVQDPLGNLIKARFGVCQKSHLAVIEMAEASGLGLVPLNQRDPYKTSSYGTGQLIKACLDYDVEKILITIGGSATNDGGAGSFAALGVRFYDKNNQLLEMNGQNLGRIDRIDISKMDQRLRTIQFDVACDVTNTLCGNEGASVIYGPQKGASDEMIQVLDKNLAHFAALIKRDLGKDILQLKGGGAAGGFGAGLSAFLNANLNSGIDLIKSYTKLEEQLKDADFVFTGEGKMDAQTRYGKTPMGVCESANYYKIPVIGFTGKKGDNVDILFKYGFNEIIEITEKNTDLRKALAEGKTNLKKAVYHFMLNINGEKL